MHYHASITLKPKKEYELPPVVVEVDLSKLDLIQNIAEPLVRHERFFCGGAFVQSEHIDKVIFAETDETSSTLMSLLAARAYRNREIFFKDDKSQVVLEGRDITRAIIEQAKLNIESKVCVGSTGKQEPGVRELEIELAKLRGENQQLTQYLHRNSNSKKVFVVHGHDVVALRETEILLRRSGLEPVILSEEPNKGQTLIEKVESNTDVGYAIVLLTPDDEGRKRGTDAMLPRARQNVIWEWGYLVGKLGRRRVACLYDPTVELPSDLHGIVRIDISNGILKNGDIIKELKAAGYTIP